MESWAPNFDLAAKRLKPDWIVKWIANPPELQPGTKMPTFYDPKDPVAAAPQDLLGGDYKRQINALRDYLLTISKHLPQAKEPSPKATSQAEDRATDASQSK
jgi:hypothetical protein